MRIPVVIVDDEEVDRLIALKRIARSDWADVLNPVFEAETGDLFLENMFASEIMTDGERLVLMDINMPGRDGFEIVEEMGRQLADQPGSEGLVVMMFTSSENAADQARAKALDLVQGYIVKPMDQSDIETIVRIFGLNKASKAPDGTMLH